MTRATESLDPADLQEFRELSHRMVDEMIDHLATIREQPSWRSMPHSVRGAFDDPLPHEGEGEEATYERFVRDVMPYPNGNIHPRFWGWVHGNGTMLGMMADMLSSGINPHLAGYDQAPKLVEFQVIEWMRELMGFPSSTSGLLVSGGTMASVTALAIARNSKAGYDVRELGLQCGQPFLTLYGSTETHNWAKKASEFLGLGSSAFRQIRVDDRYRIDLDHLASTVAEDRAAGHRPFFVIGTAGTVNTGATDDLPALADFCEREGLWLHIDGAFGALAKASPELAPIVEGMERADSVGFDLHKWMYLPFDIACVLVRDGHLMQESFAQSASYLANISRGVVAGGFPFAERGIELSRSFKALKAWMNLHAYGIDKIGRIIYQNVLQARYLGERAEADESLELLAPVDLNVVCFRFVAPGLSEKVLNDVNEEILIRLQEKGIATPSSTVLQGRFAIRCAVCNHRSTFEDFDLVADSVVSLGRDILAESSR